MRRRDFIALFGGAVICPITAQAQRAPMPVVGFLGSGSAKSDAFRSGAVQEGLKEAGYVEGRNVAFEFRWADGHSDQLPALAAELVAGKASVIVAVGGNVSALAAKSATSTVPVVFAIGGDPVKLGLVVSLNQPGGNITGVSFLANSLLAKQFEVLHEVIPKAELVGFLMNPNNPNAETDEANVLAAARSLDQKLLVVHASSAAELDNAFATLARQRTGAVVVGADPFLTGQRDKLIELAASQKMPAIYPIREYTAAGGLMSYGTSTAEAHRIVGVYTGRILKGEKPADLPVQQSTKVELIVNLKAAKALGLVIPTHIVARADEVIE